LIGFDNLTLESKTAAVTNLLPHLGVDHGEMWYRTMSGISHSVLYGITQYLRAEPLGNSGKARPIPELPVIAVANAVVLTIDAYLFTVQRHAALWGRDAASIIGKRLEIKGALLSAINRPELRVPTTTTG
jgi:hypothetical protein